MSQSGSNNPTSEKRKGKRSILWNSKEEQHYIFIWFATSMDSFISINQDSKTLWGSILTNYNAAFEVSGVRYPLQWKLSKIHFLIFPQQLNKHLEALHGRGISHTRVFMVSVRSTAVG